MFNLVEALPVMPGPCQAMKWEPIDKYRVVDVYFDFLFQNEVSSTSNICMRGCYACFCNKTEAPISFAEFLRTTARLAEDRILSFACVFATGYGTKWILGATFYYIPEVLWSVLLTQRRRWINGTFGTFLFCFSSERAKNLIRGGLHDSHHFLKSIRMIHFLWGLQLYQLLLVLIAPSIFGSSVYIGMYDSAIFCPQLFDWYFTEVSGGFRILETFTIIFMLIYAYWSLASFYIPGGKFYEPFLIVLAVIGFIYILPVQFAVWYSIPSVGITVVSGLVIANLVLPIVLSVGQSVTSGLLYASYLWWFLSLILFYLLYIPSYSFARLFDTTWGNRDTGSDSAINNAIEAYMKRQNFYFIIIMVSVNFALTWSVVEIFFLSVGTVIAVMVILFLPLLIQLVFSLVFLFIVIPLRYFLSKRE